MMLQTHQVMVFRSRSRGMGLRPVQRIKHVVDVQGGLVAGTVSNTVLILATDTPTIGANNSCITGSTVHAIYLKVEVNATTSAALANVYLQVAKVPGGNLTMPAPNAVGSSDNKKYIIHQEMVMLQQVTNSNPRTLFNGVVSIPRGYKRCGPNDELRVNLLAPGVNINFCIQCHYKEFR